jgi:hypothetical protein
MHKVPRLMNKFGLIIVIVFLGAMKIYVTLVEALMERGRQDETRFCKFQTPLNDNVHCLQVLLKFHPMYDQT